MAEFLSVDIDVLGKMVQLLRSSEQVINDAMSAMSKDSHGDIGPQELNDAADSFQTRWHYGLQQIGEHATTVADGVSQCHDTYQQVDGAFAEALQQTHFTVGQALGQLEGK